MKLHWSPRSPYVRKVMIAAHELGLSGEIELVRSVAMMTKPNPDIMADNPLSKIPTLVLEDGRVLFDSLTICEYLDHRAGGGRLFPAPGEARWQTLTDHALADGLLDLLILWRNERDKPAERQTPALLASFELRVSAGLDRLALAADRLTQSGFDIGQVTIGCCLSYIDFRFGDLNWRRTRSALAAWHETFSARASVLATEIVDA
ncbi:Gst Glutathione S-transferase [Rhabdaerophilaceae bacterium]